MIKLDKKCFTCPVRKYALKSVAIQRKLLDLNEDILDCLDEFDCNIVDIQKECREVLICQ